MAEALKPKLFTHKTTNMKLHSAEALSSSEAVSCKICSDEDEEKNSSRKIYLESRPVINRSFYSTLNKNSNNKPATISSNINESSSPLSQYSEQYKALNNLDFTAAAKILFTDQPKKKFGFDFHLIQLFFVCLPLAIYLVAQYARSEMKKMDAVIII